MNNVPAVVLKNCRLWYDGRNTNMYRMITEGRCNYAGLLAEAERAIQSVLKLDEEKELIVIKEYAENQIKRDEAELALDRAAEKVVYCSDYSFEDAVEYFHHKFLEYQRQIQA